MLDSKPMLDHSQPAYSVNQHRPPVSGWWPASRFLLGTYPSCALARSPAAKIHSLFAGSRLDCSKSTRRKQTGVLSLILVDLSIFHSLQNI